MRRGREPKPPFGSILDRDHPASSQLAACLLFNEGAGGIVANLSTGLSVSTITNSARTTWNDQGFSSSGGAGTNGWMNVDRVASVNPLSIVLDVSAPLWSADGMVMLRGSSFTDGFHVSFTAAGSFSYAGPSYDRLQSSPSSMGLVDGRRHTIVITDRGGSAETDGRLYVDGRFVVDGTGQTFGYAFGPLVTTTGPIIFGQSSDSSTTPLNITIHRCLLYGRVLSPSEIISDFVNPYAMIREPRPRRAYSGPSAAAAIKFRRSLTNRIGSRSAA